MEQKVVPPLSLKMPFMTDLITDDYEDKIEECTQYRVI